MMRSIIHLLPAIGLSLLCGSAAAQERSGDSAPYPEIALEPAALMTLPLGSPELIRGSVPCSPTFAGSASINPGFSARFGYVLAPGGGQGFTFRGISIAAGYDDISSLFLSSPGASLEAYDPVNDRYTAVNTGHTAAYTLRYVRGAVEAEVSPGGGIILRGGPNIGIPMQGSVRESEAILSPSNATFLDRTQELEITEGTGDLDDSGIRVGVGIALAYRLPLGRRVFFEPTIGADVGLTQVQPGWSPLLVRGGIGLGYAAVPDEAPAPAPPPAVEPAEQPKEIPFTADLFIEAAPDHLPVEFRRQIVTRYVPILPVIFFERDAAKLPGRYVQLPPEGAHMFDENIRTGDASDAHHQTLNIVGSELRANPGARVTITGATSVDEKNRERLAEDRARTVADYLESVWGIASRRIILRSRLTPEVASNAEYAEGREENRRVELEFTDDAIYRPLQIRMVEPITEPGEIPFRVVASSPLGIAGWRVRITGAEGAELEEFAGTGLPPQTLHWTLDNDDRERVLTSGGVRYGISVYDGDGRSVAAPDRILPVRIDTTISVATSAERPDNSAEFLLVTFDFNRAELTRRGTKELETILDRIGPESTVEITGYTDPVGDQARNIALAAERARRVAALMPKGVTVRHRGATPDEAPYDSTTPEGRFLSRTVRVVVTNPR